jgi:hypothetical protein
MNHVYALIFLENTFRTALVFETYWASSTVYDLIEAQSLRYSGWQARYLGVE